MATGPLRTKIVATLGPACDTAPILGRMVEAGLRVARINLAHGEPVDHARLVRLVRQVARRARRPVGVMADLAGPKIRVGDLREGKVALEAGRNIQLTTRPILGTTRLLSVSEPRLPRDVRRGDPIFLSDGSFELEVLGVDGETIDCRVVTGGLLLPHKGVNLPRTRLRVPSLTPKDHADLRLAQRLGIDILALSFVRTAHDVRDVRRRLGRAPILLVAKIEKREAVANLPAILDQADGVMVARGDLGVETEIEEVPLIQKRIIGLANEAAKPVITATQMLKSMVESTHPTRAEAGDVANAILDGTDAVMLSEETAMGKHPVQAVETMARIARRTEAALDPETFAQRARTAQFVAGAVSDAAVGVARDVGARAIVTPTWGGATPRYVARLRPAVPVLALSRNQSTVQALCLTWGVESVFVRELGRLEEAVRVARRLLLERGWARRGDRFVLTAGYPRGKTSNLMTVQELSEEAAPRGLRVARVR